MRMAAKATAAMVMREAGINLGWRDCSDPNDLAPRCDEAPDGEFIVRLLDSPDTADLATLGYSLVDGFGRGYQATVFLDRVRSLASRGQMETGRLLGLTMAHEIVHMVLGHTAHAPDGLLRPLWTVDEVKADVASHWRLSSAEGDELRRIMLARLQRPDARVLSAQRQSTDQRATTP